MKQLMNAIWKVPGLAAACTLALLVSAQTVRSEDGAASPFDGETLAGWTTVSGEPVSQGWEIVDGVIHLNEQDERAGNIVTGIEYGDFDLSFEFKIAPGGNSGLKYRVRNFDGRTLGCEYQILDERDSASGRPPTKGSTGSLYDVYEPAAQMFALKPHDQYNSARILVQGNRIQHWLNGRLIVSATVGDPEWERRIGESKFADVEGFGRNRYGKLMLTDHGSEVWYRNFRMQPIQTPPAMLAASTKGKGNCVNVRRRKFAAARYCRRGWFRRL